MKPQDELIGADKIEHGIEQTSNQVQHAWEKTNSHANSRENTAYKAEEDEKKHRTSPRPSSSLSFEVLRVAPATTDMAFDEQVENFNTPY